MLILSRKPGEAILIDGGVRIVVLGLDSGAVRLGIQAPSDVGILREEIVERIAEENRRAGAKPGALEWLERLERLDASEAPEVGQDGEEAGPD
jgi:carbon storage regulator